MQRRYPDRLFGSVRYLLSVTYFQLSTTLQHYEKLPSSYRVSFFGHAETFTSELYRELISPSTRVSVTTSDFVVQIMLTPFAIHFKYADVFVLRRYCLHQVRRTRNEPAGATPDV